MRSHSIDLTSGPIGRKLLAFALPLVATNLLQNLYQAADNAVVGRFVGKDALAAVGATSSATALILNIIVGMAVGATIVNANLRGAKKERELRKSMHATVALSLVGGILFSILGQILCRPLLVWMNCPENIIEQSELYMRIIFCGTPGTMVYNFGSGILRTCGDSKRPMIIMALSGLANVILNLIFVLCFHMTVDGVALATIISKYLAAGSVIWILFSKKDDYKLSVSEVKLYKTEITNIVKVGLPCGINATVFSLSNTIVSAAVNVFGATVVASGVASNNITVLLYAVLGSFYSACVSFTGQCYGAGKYKRIDGMYVRSVLICVIFMVISATGITFFPEFFIRIFNTDPEVIVIGSLKLRIISWSYLLYGVTEVTIGALRGMKKSSVPTAINVVCICVLRVAWVMFVCPMDPDNLMLLYFCYPVSYICSTAALIVYFLHCRKVLFKSNDKAVSTTVS